MLFLRLLLFLTAAYLFFLLLGSLLRWRKRRRDLGSNWTAQEEMIQDPQCHSYLPKGEAIYREGHYFCSEECARAFLSH